MLISIGIGSGGAGGLKRYKLGPQVSLLYFKQDFKSTHFNMH